jgi:hypothetical protein
MVINIMVSSDDFLMLIARAVVSLSSRCSTDEPMCSFCSYIGYTQRLCNQLCALISLLASANSTMAPKRTALPLKATGSPSKSRSVNAVPPPKQVTASTPRNATETRTAKTPKPPRPPNPKAKPTKAAARQSTQTKIDFPATASKTPSGSSGSGGSSGSKRQMQAKAPVTPTRENETTSAADQVTKKPRKRADKRALDLDDVLDYDFDAPSETATSSPVLAVALPATPNPIPGTTPTRDQYAIKDFDSSDEGTPSANVDAFLCASGSTTNQQLERGKVVTTHVWLYIMLCLHACIT